MYILDDIVLLGCLSEVSLQGLNQSLFPEGNNGVHGKKEHIVAERYLTLAVQKIKVSVGTYSEQNKAILRTKI